MRFLLLALVVAGLFFTSAVYASWTPPLAAAPNDSGVSAPLNVGSDAQDKLGDLTAANFIGWSSLSSVGPLSVFSPAGGGGVTRRFQVSAPAGSPSALSLYTASQAEILRLSNGGASWFTGGLLGLGTVTPAATLDVNGSFRFFNPASPPVAGYVLGTDADGNASWQPPAGEVVSPPAEGGGQTGMIVINAGEEPPECTEETRSNFLFIKAESGAEDGLQICTKDADDKYAWRVVQVFNL